MKRRSPWLTFAACALLNGPLQAERAPKKAEQPRLALSTAANAVEMELEKRGLSDDHAVSSMSMVSTYGPAHYVAQIEPPILISSEKRMRLAFQVEMDGRVTPKGTPVGRQSSRTPKFT